MRLNRWLWLWLLPALLAGTGTRRDVEPLLRAAQSAAVRGEVERAVQLYEQARRHSTDPGFVAFNLATLHYQQARAGQSRALAEAEAAYRCCLEADDPRRALAQFSLGNCLLLRGSGPSPEGLALRGAIDRYTLCLRDPLCSPELAQAARHNRQRARLLLAQIPAAASPSDPGGGEEEPKQPAPSAPGKTPSGPASAGDPDKGAGSVQPQPLTETDPQAPKSSRETAGKGALTPVPDRADTPPLSAVEAREHLERAWERIQQDWRTHRRSQARPAAAGGKDW